MDGDEQAMKWLVANYGPVAVSVYVTNAFTQYKTGVYYEKGCPTDELNHALVDLKSFSRYIITTFSVSSTGHSWIWNGQAIWRFLVGP